MDLAREWLYSRCDVCVSECVCVREYVSVCECVQYVYVD
jgi:hypothetical protein